MIEKHLTNKIYIILDNESKQNLEEWGREHFNKQNSEEEIFGKLTVS